MSIQLKHARSELTGERVGFYGCDAGTEPRVVIVGEEERRKKSLQTGKVDCPACGKEHRAKFLWRNRKDSDRDAEVLV